MSVEVSFLGCSITTGTMFQSLRAQNGLRRESLPNADESLQDLSLPRTMISRLAKGVLPSNTQIQKDALSALSKSATVFVNFIATT